MNISKKDLHKTLRKFKGTNWDQSPIFKRLYEEEFGQLGGEPYGCLVGDYYFDHQAPDVELLGEMSKIAAAIHAPFISGASSALLGMDSWQELSNPRDLTKIFTTPDYGGLALAARVRGRPLSRPHAAALPGAAALRRQVESGRGVRLRGGHGGGRQREVHLGQRRVRHGGQHQPLVQAVRVVLANSRHRIGRARSRGCRRTPSRPTTAAWT